MGEQFPEFVCEVAGIIVNGLNKIATVMLFTASVAMMLVSFNTGGQSEFLLGFGLGIFGAIRSMTVYTLRSN